MSWEQHLDIFRAKYVPLVERKRLEHECLSLKQMTKSVPKITKMFKERALFCPEYVASEQAQMSRYLRMLKKEIRECVSTQQHQALTEMHSSTRSKHFSVGIHLYFMFMF